MTLSTKKYDFLKTTESLTMLNKLFHFNDENFNTFLREYLTNEELIYCLEKGDTNYERIWQLIKIINQKQDNQLYIALFQKLKTFHKMIRSFMIKMKDTLNPDDGIDNDEDDEEEEEELVLSKKVLPNNNCPTDENHQMTKRMLTNFTKEAMVDMKTMCDEQEKLFEFAQENNNCIVDQIKLTILQNRYDELQSTLNKMRQFINDLRKQNEEIKRNETKYKEECEELKKEIKQLKVIFEEKSKSLRIEELSSSSRIFSNTLDEEESTRIFTLAPTERMKMTNQAYFESFHRSLLMWTENGSYPIYNWREDTFAFNKWNQEWNLIVNKKKGKDFLRFPDLMLPTELGGFIITFWLEWEKGLYLYGFLPRIDLNVNSGSSFDLKMKIELFISEDVTLVKTEKITIPRFNGSSSSKNKLLKISDNVFSHWQLPKSRITVFPYLK